VTNETIATVRTMKAAVYYGAHDVRVERVPIPTPKSGEALVRVLRCGVCGTDASEWSAGPIMFAVDKQHRVSGHQGPMIPGHEFIGEIVTAPPESGLATGDLVASCAGVSCGHCPRCLEGRTNICENYYTLGLNTNGGLAEYVASPTQVLVRIPAGIPLDRAGLAQPLAVGLHAARQARVNDGDRVVIIGAGVIGSLILMGLLHLHSDLDVTVVDFAGPKLPRAMEIGATRTIEPSDALASEVRNTIGARGADVTIEASGAPGQLTMAIALTRSGGTVLAVGLPKRPPEVDVHDLIVREITMMSTNAHVCAADMPEALALLGDRLPAELVFDSVVSLDDVAATLERLASGSLDGKVLIDPSL
jgi:(R,R)-butanediol dehydrogenase/meso-butanediol dehydrogenase/diacetyl reductase